ncbi:MAG: hypothetical protein JW749_01255 [Sedimentisphaerales bacterium]|nr:hypothetical protein [Sedimentisphaerales bacterium]
MEPVENNKEAIVKKPKRRILRKVLLAIAILLVIVILAVVFAAPAYVSSGSFRKMIIARANAGGTGEVDFADLSMSWGKGISVSGISFKDNAESLSVEVKGFSTKPKYGALLTGNLSFGETVINEPRIEIDVEKLKTEDRKQKTEDRKRKTETKAGLPIERIDMVVKNGGVTIKGGDGAIEISQINSSVNLRPETEKSSFDVGAMVVGEGSGSKINAKGEVKPGTGWDFKKTSGYASIEVNNLDLKSLESILAIANIDVEANGVITTNITASMKDGMLEKAAGQLTGKNLEIKLPQLKGDRIKTSILDVNVSAVRAGDLMNVEMLTLQTDWLKAEVNGSAPMNLATLEDFLKPDSKSELNAYLECDIPAITAQLSETIKLKKGMKITSGRVAGDVQTLTEGGVRKLAGKVSVDGLAGFVDGRTVTIDEPIRGQALITADGERITFEKADITSSFANMTCTGTPEAFGYEAKTDLDKLTDELGQFADIDRYKLAGQLTSKGQISNNESTTMIVSSTRIDNLRASPTADITISEPKATIDVVAAIEKKTDVLLVKQFKAGTSLGQFSVNDGRIPLVRDSKEPMELTAAAREVDLARLQPYLVMAKAISKDVQLGGIVESDVTVIQKEGSYKLKTNNTKISNLLVKAPEKAPFVQETVSLMLEADVNPETKNWEANIELTGTNINIKGNFFQKVEGDTSNLQGKARLDYDWGSLSGMLSAFMPGGLIVEGRRKDEVSFSSSYPAAGKTEAMLANLNAQAKMGFDKATYMGLNIGATDVNMKVDKGLLTLTPFTTTVNNGRLNFGGTADFKKKPAMFRTPPNMRIVENVQLNVEIARKLLARINPVFTGTSSIIGLASFDCNSLAVPITGGRLEDIAIAGVISLNDVKMTPTGLLGAILTAAKSADDLMTIHPTALTVNDGFARYANMKMDIGRRPFVFSGIVPIDPDRQIEKFSVVLPIEDGITAYVKGTPNKPELDVGKMIQDELIQTGLDLLFEKAKKK